MATDRNRKLVTHERILEAAFEQFARYGFADATVRRIAKHAGVSHAAVHWHFGNKASVYAETVRIAGERFVEAIRGTALADAPFREVAVVWIRHLTDDAPTARLLRSLGTDHRHPTVERTTRSVNGVFRDFWRDWLREHHLRGLRGSDADLTDLAHAIVATLAGMAVVKFHDEPEPPLTSLATLAQLLEHPKPDDRALAATT